MIDVLRVKARQGVRMKPIWDFILSSLRESLSRQSGQSLAGIAIVLILLAVLIPVYLVMKLFRTSGTIEVSEPTITGDVLDALISTGQTRRHARTRRFRNLASNLLGISKARSAAALSSTNC